MADTKNNTFSEKIVNFDYDKYYTKNRRIIIHILVWVFYTFFLQIGYYLGYRFSLQSSILLSLRMTTCNIAVFYLLFYFVIPKTINNNKILLFIASIFILLEVWLLINHFFYVLIYKLNFSLDFGALNEVLAKTVKKSLLEVINPKNVLAYFFDIVSAISPVLFLKVAFDLSKTYAQSIKANREIEKLNYDKILIENKFLLSQLNPHFLFNTLNNLYVMSVKKSEEAPELVLKLSNIMRYTLYDANVNKIAISKEVEFMNNYFDMEKLRYPKDYFIDKKITITNQNIDIEPLLFFVFIENAFKYGLKTEQPFLEMVLNVSEDKIFFSIKNDFSENNKDTQYKGIGIENAKRRLGLLYPNQHQLKIQQLANTFIVELQIDIK